MISAREALDITNEAVSRKDSAQDVQELLLTIDTCISSAARQLKYGVHTKVLAGSGCRTQDLILQNLKQRGYQAQIYSEEILIISWSPKL
jgi:hypothetical protein